MRGVEASMAMELHATIEWKGKTQLGDGLPHPPTLLLTVDAELAEVAMQRTLGSRQHAKHDRRRSLLLA